ncbi:MAG: sulfotransferase [Acidimicrobiia bacterium]
MSAGAIYQRLRDALKPVVPVQARRFLVNARHRLRALTARWRVVPDFVIIGCQRGGTSSLYRYLGLHPDISASLRKETEYFTAKFPEGEAWYRAHFPLALRHRLAAAIGKRRLSFEATPDYLVDPRAPARCHALLPGARIVVMLREPGERALSQFHHNVRLGLETETFDRAIELEESRISADRAEMAENPSTSATAFRRFSYLTRGDYAEQLQRWFDLYPRDRFLIVESEEFFSDPDRVLGKVLEFVGVRQWSPPEFRNYSYPERDAVGHEEVPAALSGVLDERFNQSNKNLRELIDTDLGWLERVR